MKGERERVWIGWGWEEGEGGGGEGWEGQRTYNRLVVHGSLCGGEHTADIGSRLHEAKGFAKGHLAKDVPSQIRDPICDIAGDALVGTLHEAGLELVGEASEGLVHDGLILLGCGEGVELLDGTNVPRVKLIAAGPEDVLDDLSILHGIIDGVELTLFGVGRLVGVH